MNLKVLTMRHDFKTKLQFEKVKFDYSKTGLSGMGAVNKTTFFHFRMKMPSY